MNTAAEGDQKAGMTNFDLIRVMPIKKLAEFLCVFAKSYQTDEIIDQSKVERWLLKEVTHEEWEDRPIAQLNLTPQVYEALYRAGIKTLGQLSRYREYDLLRMRNIGESGVQQIKDQFFYYTEKTIGL